MSPPFPHQVYSNQGSSPCIPNSTLAIQSSALAVLAVRQQNTYCSSAPPTSHSERESGQTTLQWPVSCTEAWGTCDALPPSSGRLEFPSDEREQEEETQSPMLYPLYHRSCQTYLCPSLPVEHRPSVTPRHRTLFWAAVAILDTVGPLLFQLCFSVLLPFVARPASLSLPLRVPGQGFACGVGFWLLEGVSDPAPLPLEYLLGHWFMSCWLPRIFIWDLRSY